MTLAAQAGICVRARVCVRACQYAYESLPRGRSNHFEEAANCASSALHMMGTETGGDSGVTQPCVLVRGLTHLQLCVSYQRPDREGGFMRNTLTQCVIMLSTRDKLKKRRKMSDTYQRSGSAGAACETHSQHLNTHL